jgi:hypothetical protein
MKGDNEMETKQVFEIRFSSVIDGDMTPRCEDVERQIASGEEMDDDTKAFAEFVIAPRRIVVKRGLNNTVAVDVSIDAIKALKKELLWRKQDLECARYDERDSVMSYRAFTSLINQCITAIKNCNKVLIGKE